MQVYTFEIRKTIRQQFVHLYPSLLSIKGKHYLVDCGYEETFPEFVEALGLLGLSTADLHALLLSHDDIDHIGAVALFKEANPQLKVYGGAIEAASLMGHVKSQRLVQAEQSLSQLPEEHLPWAHQFIRDLENIKRFPLDGILQDGDAIEGEVRVIATPGHTAGHLSFYLPSEETLIANDALVIENDHLDIANPMYTLDMREAIRSVERIREINPRKIICYHGGIITEGIPERLNTLLEKYNTIAP